MSTQAPMSTYAGNGSKRPSADTLRRMTREGRVVTRDQKMRWRENDEFYRGNQWVRQNQGQSQVERMIRQYPGQPVQMDFNSYNQLRRYTDGRVALLTKERPPYEVVPEDNDADSIDAARQAEKFLAARWGRSGWNIKSRLSELAKNADIHGISYLYVGWDPDDGDPVNQQIPVKADGSPVTSRNEYEALKAEDPSMQSLWRMETAKKPIGDICWRVVLPGALSIDPFATKNFDDARWVIESRIRPREEAEAELGMSYQEAVRSSQEAMNESSSGQVQFEDLAVDGEGSMNERKGVVKHYLYHKPCKAYPDGAHVEFYDRAPAKPVLTEPWGYDLPYFCYVPRPDPGHYIRSRGIVDDLKPIQRDFNQTLYWVRKWLKKTAEMPVLLPRGSMVSDSLYNEDGWAEFNAQFGPPAHMPTPSEPTAILTNNLVWMSAQMEQISGVSSYAQGSTTPGGPDSNAGISGLIQQTEQNLSEVEANFVEAIEWGCSRSLRLVKDHYSIPRAVAGVGVDDAEQFRAFTGAMLRGVGRMRVNGPLMPKSKAMRMNAIAQFAPILGDKILPYMAGLIDGDPTELQRDVEIDRQNEKGAIRELVGLVTNPTALNVYQNFEEDKKAFSEAIAAAQASGVDPMVAMQQAGIQPPQLTPNLQSAGVDMPMVEDFLNAPIALKALDDFRKGDGYRNLHEMAKQLLRERAASLKQMVGQQIAAMAQQQPVGQQQGSSPNPKGTPSAPKQSPSPGGHA